MNLMTIQRNLYASKCQYNKHTQHWELYLSCEKINDYDSYVRMSKQDLEILRDNAKNMHETITQALENSTNERNN